MRVNSESSLHIRNAILMILGLPLFYLFTAGPGMRLAIRGNNRRAVEFYGPVYYAAQHKPLAPMLRPYFRVWGIGFPGDLYIGGKLVEEVID